MNPKKLNSIIIGSYLGDGCIPKEQTKNSNNYLKIQHSIKQIEYATWKSDLFEGFATKPIIINRMFKNKPYTCVAFQTKVHPFCTRLRKLYKDGKKTLNLSTLSYLDELGLAIWYMDDGSIVRNRYKRADGTKGHLKFRGIKIATCSFSDTEIELLRNVLKHKWDLDFKVYYSRNSEKLYPVISIFGDDARRFIEIIKPYVPDCMKYKIDTKQEAP